MLHLTQETKILLALEPIDFRKQIDGLVALCEQVLSHDPRSGQLFVFINRNRSMLKVLCYEDNGYWLATKRLSRGRYALWPSNHNAAHTCPVLASELRQLLKTSVARVRKTL